VTQCSHKPWYGEWKKDLHTIVDVLEMLPSIGTAAGGVHAAIYLAEGDYENAALSALAMVPIAGPAAKWSIKGGKAAAKLLGKGATKAAPGATKAIKETGKRVYDAVNKPVSEFVHGTLKNSRWDDPVANVVNALGFQACFVAGTPVRLVDGWRAIEELLVGDRLLSRSEWDAAGALVACEVTAVHVREALVWELVLGGQTIVTTAEHPFFSVERGWVKLQELAVGETLVGHDGQWTKVASVRNTNEWRTVYNVTVAEHHTYFVGKDEWGFSVWVHNARYPVQKDARRWAVAEAWRMERELVQATGRGTRKWTDAQKKELLETGKVRRYVGHHINSVKESPLFAALPDNIEFVTRRQHLLKHKGRFQNPTRGNLIDRIV
jgi:hypothetical protein